MPNMDILLNMSNCSKSVISYFDPMTFLDCHSDFEAVLGLAPTLYRASPCKQDVGKTITSQIQAYARKCMLDTFLSICQTDDVRVDNNDYVGKIMHEIFKQITSIVMEVRVGGRSTIITPEQLYAKCISTSACLSVDATTCSITLCFSFLIV